MTISHFPIPAQELKELCQRHGVKKLAFFGSILTDQFRPDSDVDVLIEFESVVRPTYLLLARIEGELSELLGGRKIDLRTPNELSRFFRDDVVKNAYIQYGA